MTRVLEQHGAFFAAGFLAIATQVLLLRELVVDVAGDELAIGVGLAAWLLGIAAGARVGRRRRAGAAAGDAARGISLLAVLPVLAILAGRVLRSLVGPAAGELPGLGLTVSLAVGTLAPPGMLVGWTFTTLASAASRLWGAGEGIARLYVVESLGSLVGGLLVALVVGPRLAPLPAAALFGATAALVASLATRSGLLVGRRLLGLGAGGAAVLLLASLGLDAWSERLRFAGTAPGLTLRGTLDTPWQHLDLGERDGVFHLYASGQYASSFPDEYSSESTGHLVACLAARPERVLLLGGVERGLVPVLLRHPVRELVLVEPDPWAFAFLRDRLPAGDRAALDDARVRVIHDDPRRVLARDGPRFGLILHMGPDPVTLLQARLGTVEFFRLAAARLEGDGVLVVSVVTAPNVLTGETAALAGSLYRALRGALPVVRATPGPDTLLAAGWSAEAVTLDPVGLAARWEARGVASASFGPALLPLLLPRDRIEVQEAALQAAAETTRVSRDDQPASFLHALARRQQTTAGPLGRAVGAAARVPPALLVLFAALPSLFVVAPLLTAAALPARRAAAAASHAVAATGAAGMGFTLLILFAFQTQVGALYGELGTLTALFMLGLALGATLARGATEARAVESTASPGPANALRLALACAFAYALALPWTLEAAARVSRSGVTVAIVAHGALLLAAGVVTGALFPLAASTRLAAGDGPGETAGRLETADHVGAAGAALFGSVLFVPTLGLAHSAWVLAVLLAIALGAVVVAVPARGR